MRWREVLYLVTLLVGTGDPIGMAREGERNDSGRAAIRGTVVRAGDKALSGLHALTLFPERTEPRRRLRDVLHRWKPLLRIPIERGEGHEPHRFSVEGIAPGRYQLIGFASGHLVDRRLAVSAGDRTLNVELSRDDAVEPYREYHLIHGRVLDGLELAPLSGVTVTFTLLYPDGNMFQSKEVLDERGQYVIVPELLPAGTHIMAEARGHVEAARRIDRVSDEFRHDLVLQPFSGERLAIFTTPAGRPLRGEATIEIGGVAKSVRRPLDENGAVALDGIPPGDRSVRVYYEAYGLNRGHGSKTRTVDRTLTVTGEPQRIRIPVQVGETLDLSLEPPPGLGLFYVRLWVRLEQPDREAEGWIDLEPWRKGNWFIAGLPPSGRLEVIATGALRRAPEETIAAYASEHIDLAGVAPSRMVDLRFCLERKVPVRVVDARGNPAARPYSTPRPLIPPFRWPRDKERISLGQWSLEELGGHLARSLSGNGVVGTASLVHYPGSGEPLYVLSDDGGLKLTAEELLALREGQTLTVRPEGFVRGKVVGARGDRVLPLSVELEGGRAIQTYTDYGGTFCLPVGDGVVRTVAIGAGRDRRVVRDPAPERVVRIELE